MSLLVLCLILLTVTLSPYAQLAQKWGVTRPDTAIALQSGAVDAMLTAALSALIWLGLIIYVIGVSLWLWILSEVDLSVACPFVGVSFLVTVAFGAFLLQEESAQCALSAPSSSRAGVF